MKLVNFSIMRVLRFSKRAPVVEPILKVLRSKLPKRPKYPPCISCIKYAICINQEDIKCPDMAVHIDLAKDWLTIAMCLAVLRCKLFRYHVHNQTIHPVREEEEVNDILESEYGFRPRCTSFKPMIVRHWVMFQFSLTIGLVNAMKAYFWTRRYVLIVRNWIINGYKAVIKTVYKRYMGG